MTMHDHKMRKADLPALTGVEMVALDFLTDAANAGRQVTQQQLAIAVGSQSPNSGTAPGILKRLENKGRIRRKYFQRGVQVCIVATGQCTAEPACKAPHWREIANKSETITPVMAIHQVEAEVPNIAAYIHMMMREENMSYQSASIALLSRGIAHREEERGSL
jgi:hypothetical protein